MPINLRILENWGGIADKKLGVNIVKKNIAANKHNQGKISSPRFF